MERRNASARPMFASFDISSSQLRQNSGQRFINARLLYVANSTASTDQYSKLQIASLTSHTWGFMLRVNGPSSDHYQVHLPKGRLIALNSHCTAIPCLVDWISTESMFRCLCHNCGFSMEGINVDGPAGRPLQRYQIVLHGQNIIVDKSVVFRQELNEGILSDFYIDMETSSAPKTSN